MRAGLVVALIAVLCCLGASSRAGVLPDLPGMDIAERAASGRPSNVKSAASNAPAETHRVPAPDSDQATKQAAGPSRTEVVTNLPGGGSIPLIGDIASEQRSSTLPLAAIALIVMALFTRFLVRLNSV